MANLLAKLNLLFKFYEFNWRTSRYRKLNVPRRMCNVLEGCASPEEAGRKEWLDYRVRAGILESYETTNGRGYMMPGYVRLISSVRIKGPTSWVKC